MNMAQQKWSNRGNQSSSVGGSVWKRRIKTSTSRFLLLSQIFSFVVLLLCLLKILNPLQDLPELWSHNLVAATTDTQIVEAIAYGIVPNDGQDDSARLQTLINRLPSQGTVEIKLPYGEIDLLQPLEINRSNTTIKGEGVGRTILQANLKKKTAKAAILIRPRALPSVGTKVSPGKVKNIQLRGFTLLQMQPTAAVVDGIVLENVAQAKLRNLDLDRSGRHALVRRQTDDIKVEYVSLVEK